jgi:hypothetical protein
VEKTEKTIKFELSRLEELLETLKEYILDADRVIKWEVTNDGIKFIDRATDVVTFFEAELDWDKPLCLTCDRYDRCTRKDRDCPFNPFVD